MYDQYTSVYNRYRVLKTELTVDIINNSSTVPCAACLYADNITASISSYTVGSVLPYAQFGYALTNANSKCQLRLKLNLNIANVLGYEFNVDEDLSAPVTTNPV
jgi:hypothetical protein